MWYSGNRRKAWAGTIAGASACPARQRQRGLCRGPGRRLTPHQRSAPVAHCHNYGETAGKANPGLRAAARPGNHANNCTRCAVATDQRIAGAEVSAAPTQGPQVLGDIENFYGKSFSDVDSYDAVVKQLQSAGPGSRGILALTRPRGVGHVFNVVHDGNGVVFLDGKNLKLLRTA